MSQTLTSSTLFSASAWQIPRWCRKWNDDFLTTHTANHSILRLPCSCTWPSHLCSRMNNWPLVKTFHLCLREILSSVSCCWDSQVCPTDPGNHQQWMTNWWGPSPISWRWQNTLWNVGCMKTSGTSPPWWGDGSSSLKNLLNELKCLKSLVCCGSSLMRTYTTTKWWNRKNAKWLSMTPTEVTTSINDSWLCRRYPQLCTSSFCCLWQSWSSWPLREMSSYYSTSSHKTSRLMPQPTSRCSMKGGRGNGWPRIFMLMWPWRCGSLTLQMWTPAC